MKSTVLLLMSMLILVSCSKNDDNSQPETTELNFYENSSIVVPENTDYFFVTIDSGNKLVFEYKFNKASDPKLPDSGFSEIIYFEIDPGISEFNFSNEDFVLINAFYRQICYCPVTESVPIIDGSISGMNINVSTWQVDINVNVVLGEEYLINKSISGNFTLQ